jgi:hypothetical protein
MTEREMPMRCASSTVWRTPTSRISCTKTVLTECFNASFSVMVP